MGGIPAKNNEASSNEASSNEEASRSEDARRVGDGLTDIVSKHWPADVLTVKMDVHLKSITIRALREIAECTVFPGGMPGPSLECFARSCTERLEARWGHEQWFWDWPWPEIIGSAATHFWPAHLAPFDPASDRVTQYICARETQVSLEGLLRRRSFGVHP